jgi:hypothetical protein
MDHFSQKFNLVLVLLASTGTFLYFRNKDKEFVCRDKLFFVLGLIFVAAGCTVVQLMHGSDVLLDCILLKEILVSGKLIVIGYAFILLSFFFHTDKLVEKLFTKKEKE